MKKLFENIRDYLPLKVEFLEIEEYYISFGAKDWNFYSDSNWRLLKGKNVIMSDDNFDLESFRKIIFSEIIQNIIPLTNDMIEPVFNIGNIYKLEIFSKTESEPWKLSLPDIVYVP
ncbi:MAG: hypothetical protein JEZ03_17495 [Bacteroidales bacterium]|nr:hypothetical protein [Bacteroidales bacterium]